MMECALKHVEIQMGNLLLLMGDDPLSPEVGMTSCMHCLCAAELIFNLCGFFRSRMLLADGPTQKYRHR